MNADNLLPDDDFSDLESALKSLRPRAVSCGFADRAIVEPVLQSVSPAAPGEGFADGIVVAGVLAGVSPAEPGEGFAARVVTEGVLAGVTPAPTTAGFADRVLAASVSGNRSRIIPFVRYFVPLAAAAALAVMVVPSLVKHEAPSAAVLAGSSPDAAPVTAVAEASSDLAPGFPEEALHLPVVNLPDGRAYRPVIRSRGAVPASFRAGPGGVVMPVSMSAGSEIEYRPVTFE